MPIKLQSKDSFYQSRSIASKSKRVITIVLVCLILMVVTVNGYKSIIVPMLVARSLQQNVEAVNIVSVYTKQFEQGVLGSIRSESSDESKQSVNQGLNTATKAQLTSQLDQLSSKVIESKNNLNKGTFDDTQNFYDSVYYSFETFQSLLSTTRSYLTYQFCFTDAQKQLDDANKLKKTIIVQFQSVSNLYDQPELYTQLSSVYQLIEGIYATLNTCFGNDFSYLNGDEAQRLINDYTGYVKSQVVLLDQAYTDATNKNEEALENGFVRLADNETKSKDFFSSDLYLVIKYQPLDIIAQKNRQLTNQYAQVEQNLKDVKSKYNLS